VAVILVIWHWPVASRYTVAMAVAIVIWPLLLP
jgi:hypothetical protein